MQTSNSYLDGYNDPKKQVEHPDQKYIRALRNNDISLVEEIYRNNSPMIIDLVKKNNGTKQDAMDLFQEILIIMHKNAHNGFVISCSLKSFLYTLCKRRWINELRRRGRSKTIKVADIQDLNYMTEAKQDAEEFTEFEEKHEFAKAIFAMLSPSCKQILTASWKRDDNGHYPSWKTVAIQLDISYNYIRKKASECKSRLMTLANKNPGFKNF